MSTIQTDTLLNGYKILQDKERFMFGIDAILLSDFASSSLRKHHEIIDLGTGNGIIPLLLTNKVKTVAGLEIQKESFDLAQQSVSLNNLDNKIKIVLGDIRGLSPVTSSIPPQGLSPLATTSSEGSVPSDIPLFPKHSFDCVTSNPPYMIGDHGHQSPTDAKAIARHEVLCTLEDVVSAADYLLKPHGSFFLIHRPFRLAEIFASLYKHKLEPKRMQMVCPFLHTEPNLVLIEAKKNANPRLKIEPELIVYDTPGQYTKEIQAIYKRIEDSKISE